MAKFKKRPLMVVEWVDATHYSSWKNVKECIEDKLIVVRSVGWKVLSSRDFIELTSSVNEYDDVSARELIPRKNIKSMRRVE